jgi:hypothetical protein
MNYIELINQFWRIRRSKRITSTQADVYFMLLDECNARGWENPFEFPNTLACAHIGITEPTLIDARARLKQLGLVDFDGGERRAKAPVYTLVYLKNLSKVRAKEEVNTEQSPSKKGNPIKNKLNKNKTKQESKRPPATNDVFDDEGGSKSEEQPAVRTRQPFTPPTVQEVDAYCKERGNSISAQKFVSYYQSNGWRVGRNAMKDWQAAVRAWEQNGFTDGKEKNAPPDSRFLGMLDIDMSRF